MSRPANYSLDDLKEAQIQIGIRAGDTVVVHSSLMHLGRLEGVLLTDNPSSVFKCLVEYLGPNGTLCVPASSWEYGDKNVPFDLKKSPVQKDLGVLSAYLTGMPQAHRSPNPIFSVAAVGEKAAWICGQESGSDFGVGSAWDRLFQINAKVLFLGSPVKFMTFVRYIEARFGVPYLYRKLFKAPIIRDGKELSMDVTALVRYRNVLTRYNVERFERDLMERGILKKLNLGEGQVAAMEMHPCFDLGIEKIEKEIHYFLESVPAYREGELPIV